HAHGCDGARNPHSARNRQGPGRRQAIPTRIAIVMPPLPSSDAPMRGRRGLPTRVKQDALHGLGNKGLGDMGKGTKAGVALVWAAALLAGAVAPALAQTKELSDKSVMTLMK